MFYYILLIYASVASASVVFEDCGSAYKLHSVYIDGCGMRLPCYITLGEDVLVSVEFYADFPSSRLDQNVVFNVNFINLITRVTPEPCEMVHCPVTSNTLTGFTSFMEVPTNLGVNQRGSLNWRVYNEDGRQVLCYSVPIQSQTPLQKILRQLITDNQNKTYITY